MQWSKSTKKMFYSIGRGCTLGHSIGHSLPSAWLGSWPAKKAQKCEMLMEFAVSRGGAPKNRKLANGKLAENLLCKGWHVVHICHSVLELSRGGLPPHGPPIDPSTHRSKSGKHFLELFGLELFWKWKYFYFHFYFYLFLFFYFYFYFHSENFSFLFRKINFYFYF